MRYNQLKEQAKHLLKIKHKPLPFNNNGNVVHLHFSPQQRTILQAIANGETKIGNLFNRLKTIDFILLLLYLPISTNPDEADYIVFLKEHYPRALDDFILVNTQQRKMHFFYLQENHKEVNEVATNKPHAILEKVKQFYANQHFTEGLLTRHHQKVQRENQPFDLLIGLADLNQTAVTTYLTANQSELSQKPNFFKRIVLFFSPRLYQKWFRATDDGLAKQLRSGLQATTTQAAAVSSDQSTQEHISATVTDLSVCPPSPAVVTTTAPQHQPNELIASSSALFPISPTVISTKTAQYQINGLIDSGSSLFPISPTPTSTTTASSFPISPTVIPTKITKQHKTNGLIDSDPKLFPISPTPTPMTTASSFPISPTVISTNTQLMASDSPLNSDKTSAKRKLQFEGSNKENCIRASNI